MPLTVCRSEDTGTYNLNLQIQDRPGEFLLSIQMRGNDSSTLSATVPTRLHSSSPSMTYPIRVALILIIAPVAIFVNEAAGVFFDAFGGILGVALYGFLILAVIISFWRCVGGPSLEDTVERVQDRLESWKENEMLRLLPLNSFQDRLDKMYQNERMKSFIYLCKNGWHPERDAERALQQEQTGVENGASGKV
jgi:hypothetical protein